MARNSDNRGRISIDALNRLFGHASDAPPSIRPVERQNAVVSARESAGIDVNTGQLRRVMQNWEGTLYREGRPRAASDVIAEGIRRAIGPEGNRQLRMHMNVDVGARQIDVNLDMSCRVHGRTEFSVDPLTRTQTVVAPLCLVVTLADDNLSRLQGLPAEFCDAALAHLVSAALPTLFAQGGVPTETKYSVDPDLATHNMDKLTASVKVVCDNKATTKVVYRVEASMSQSLAHTADQLNAIKARVLKAAEEAVRKELEAIVVEAKEGATSKPTRRIDLD